MVVFLSMSAVDHRKNCFLETTSAFRYIVHFGPQRKNDLQAFYDHRQNSCWIRAEANFKQTETLFKFENF